MCHISLREDFEKSLISTLSTLSQIVTKKKFLLNKNEIGTELNAILFAKNVSSVDKHINEIILRHALLAEKIAPGSFSLVVSTLLKMFDKTDDCTKEDILSAFSKSVSVTSFHPTYEDVINITTDLVKDRLNERDLSIVIEAIKLAGFDAKMFIEKSPTCDSLEKTSGFSFDVSSPLSKRNHLVDPKVACIDGYIESVSEIHHFLEEASSAKDSCVLFIRGLSNDVLNTLKVNLDRGTLNVIPVISKFDVHGINTLNDISIVSGCDLISSNKGDLISAMTLAKLPRVQKIIIHDNNVVIKNSKTTKSVEDHVSFLRQKRQNEENEEVGKLIDERIKSLSPSQVIIRLKNDSLFSFRSQTIDLVIRSISNIVRFGVIIENGIIKPALTRRVSDFFSAKCYHVLSEIGSSVT